MKYRNIAIIGAGAVGAYLIWGLSKKKELSVCVIADGERKERFERDGFIINDKQYNPSVRSAKEIKDAVSKGPAEEIDLLIVATKYNALRGALEDIKDIVSENTTVMSLMNGVDSEEIISEVIDEGHIIYSTIKVASERKGNIVKFDPETTIGIIYGEKDKNAPKDRVEGLNELFADTGIHYRASDVIIEEIWCKFRLNVPYNQPQAMIGCGIGANSDSEHVAFLSKEICEELDAIAKAKGIDFTKVAETSLRGSRVKKRARYSTLQDLDAKRHTEVDMFAGAIVRMGKELGIPTPYNEFTYHMIKALEEKNDGLFDYED